MGESRKNGCCIFFGHSHLSRLVNKITQLVTQVKQIIKSNTPGNGCTDLRACLERAKRGDADAQVQLGNRYREGNGVSMDLVEAVSWYRKAADQGDAKAQCSIGFNYYTEGESVEAVKWYRKAAEQGDALGQRCLAHMYAYG